MLLVSRAMASRQHGRYSVCMHAKAVFLIINQAQDVRLQNDMRNVTYVACVLDSKVIVQYTIRATLCGPSWQPVARLLPGSSAPLSTASLAADVRCIRGVGGTRRACKLRTKCLKRQVSSVRALRDRFGVKLSCKQRTNDRKNGSQGILEARSREGTACWRKQAILLMIFTYVTMLRRSKQLRVPKRVVFLTL